MRTPPATRAALVDRLEALSQWESNGRRAPHKPLLLLFALGRVQAGAPAVTTFAEAEPVLAGLLAEFGPPWPTTPLYPWWYLRSDGLWEVPGGDALQHRGGKSEPKITALRAGGVGRFPAAVDAMLRKDAELVREAAQVLLNRHFEPSLHAAIAAACGLDLTPAPLTRPRRRSLAFRRDVLIAYEYRCAACGWNVFLGRDVLGLEAAHVFWHTLGGPDELENGVCLCALHHLALDRGALGVGEDGTILISQHVNGSDGVPDAFHALAGRPLRRPQPGNPVIDARYAAWHRTQVFRGPAREAS